MSKRVPPDLAPDDRIAVVLFFHDHEWEPPILAAADVPPERLARMKGPIGLVPSAQDARTLAVSVLAEVLSKTQVNPA